MMDRIGNPEAIREPVLIRSSGQVLRGASVLFEVAREFWWTLGELWSVRWNPGFSVPTRRYLFRPWARRFGGNVATIGVFAVSGWLHEIVISLPAVGGFGLPTIYFLIQGAGVLFEKRLNNPLVKRLFTIVVAGAFAATHSRTFCSPRADPVLCGIGNRGRTGDMTSVLILKLAAVAHLGLIAAGSLMPRTVGLWRHVAILPDFERHLFKVYYGFIGFTLMSFGMQTSFLPEELATGSALASRNLPYHGCILADSPRGCGVCLRCKALSHQLVSRRISGDQRDVCGVAGDLPVDRMERRWVVNLISSCPQWVCDALARFLRKPKVEVKTEPRKVRKRRVSAFFEMP